MNYRHAFHAGSFADVHKHCVLTHILVHLRSKAAPFRVLDTHAGAGRYDLSGAEARRSGEWRLGIELVRRAPPERARHALLAPYVDAVAALNGDGELRIYPGSPLIAAHFLRAQDRLIACELEPQSAAALTRALGGDRRAKVLTIDGWTALNAYVPPKERRGLVLIDPPFEEAADFARLPRALAAAYRKWPTGIYLLWYPIKDRRAADALARRLRRLAIPKVLRSELTLGPPRADAGLIGSGVVVVNPPFTLERDLRALMPMLAAIFSPRAAVRTDWLAAERAAAGNLT